MAFNVPVNHSPLNNSVASAGRRSSSRTIKRKKFDDELVETTFNLQSPSNLKFNTRINRGTPSTATSSATTSISSVSNSPVAPDTNSASSVGLLPPPVVAPTAPIVMPTPQLQALDHTPATVQQPMPSRHHHTGGGDHHHRHHHHRKVNRYSGANGTGRKSKKHKNHPYLLNTTKDLGRWKPTDDLALVTGVQQTNDLRMVHRGTKFSCRFTLQEIQQRWYALLYDSAVSRVAVQAMRNLQPEIIASVQARTLYSKSEEALLGSIKSTSQPNLEVFQQLLETNAQTFYPSRTAKALLTHWQLMKQYHLLPDQVVQSMALGEPSMNFSEAEEAINDVELINEQRDDYLEQELQRHNRRNKHEIRIIENELSRWQVLVENVTGTYVPDFDNQTLAILRGRLVRYLMRSREITFGRSTKYQSVDIDLTLEGPAWKISRRQGTIRLRNNGDFLLSSEGKRPIFVDSRPIIYGNKVKLNNNSIIEIAGLRFIFLINQDLINVIRHEAAKLNLNP